MKGNEYVITVFASATKYGKDLVSKINNDVFRVFVDARLTTEGLTDVKSVVKVIYPSDSEHNTIHFQVYQKQSDIVIFDASIEEDENGLLGDNYKCATHAPYFNSNVLVVSRTVLPLNFIPHTTNVLPFGENFNIDEDGKIQPIVSYTNDSIVGFIQEKVAILIHNLVSGISFNDDPDNSVKKDPQLYLSNGEKVAFISYRSYYYDDSHKCNGANVETLKQYILDYHKAENSDEQWKVLFYPPGGLSQDCPTEYLRWALFTYVNNVFIHVDEVWIFDTKSTDEKSYWDSWFTQGEFLSLMYLQRGMPDHMPKVYLYNPHTGISTELKSLPTISDVESRELSLLEANSDILWGDYAALRNVILFLDKWNSYGSFKKSLWHLGAKSLSLIAKLFWKGIPPTDFDRMSKEHAYQLDFLTNRIFSCPNCIITGHNIESFKNESFIHQFIRIGDKDNPASGFFTLDKDEFIEAIERGYVECPSCHKRIMIKRNPSQDFYLWKKWTARTNPENNDWYIEKVPAYSVIDV